MHQIVNNNYKPDIKSCQVKINNIAIFNSYLPEKPYCTDCLNSGLRIRPRQKAIAYKYIQANFQVINSLIFDIDRQGAALEWEKANLPAPNIAVINRENTHAHLIYFLASGVFKFDNARLRPLRYLAAVESAYIDKLKADAGYSGLITKNPNNNFWRIWNITNQLYDLAELADYVNLKKIAAVKEKIQTGYGRNCDIFENGRKYAYEAVRSFRNNTYDNFYANIFKRLKTQNSGFKTPLQENEIRATAKSISKWTWKHDEEAQSRFIRRQAKRGRIGGTKSGIARYVKNEDKRVSARLLRAQGKSYREIAKELDISSHITIINWLKK